MALTILFDDVVELADSEESLALVGVINKSRTLLAQLIPNAGQAIQNAKIEISLDGENWSVMTDEEDFVAGVVGAIQVRDIPGRFARVSWDSGVSKCLVWLG